MAHQRSWVDGEAVVLGLCAGRGLERSRQLDEGLAAAVVHAAAAAAAPTRPGRRSSPAGSAAAAVCQLGRAKGEGVALELLETLGRILACACKQACAALQDCHGRRSVHVGAALLSGCDARVLLCCLQRQRRAAWARFGAAPAAESCVVCWAVAGSSGRPCALPIRDLGRSFFLCAPSSGPASSPSSPSSPKLSSEALLSRLGMMAAGWALGGLAAVLCLPGAAPPAACSTLGGSSSSPPNDSLLRGLKLRCLNAIKKQAAARAGPACGLHGAGSHGRAGEARRGDGVERL